MGHNAKSNLSKTLRPSAFILLCSASERFDAIAARLEKRTDYMIAKSRDKEEALWVLRKYLARNDLGELVLVAEDSPLNRSGLELCRFVRSHPRLSQSPVMIVSGDDDPQRCIEALDAGADDFLRESASLRETESRIGVLLRRLERRDTGGGRWPFERVEIGSLVIDTARFEVRVQNLPVKLTHKEFTVLTLFASRPGQVLPYDEILDYVWGEHSPRSRGNLKVQIHSLRKKLEGAPPIESIRGLGYRMSDSHTTAEILRDSHLRDPEKIRSF